jgi:hypothetical protein
MNTTISQVINIMQTFLLLAIITTIGAFSPSMLRPTVHLSLDDALGAVKTPLDASPSSRLKRTKEFVDWAKESEIK